MTVQEATGLPLQRQPLQSQVPDGGHEATLGKRVRTGAMWTAASNVLLRLGNILVLAVVARIVSPAELGVFALAAALQILVGDLAVLGVSSAIARADLDADEIGPTVVTISVVSGLLLSCVMAIWAAPLASLLGAPAAADAIRVLAVCVALTGALAVPTAQLQRNFRQDVLFRANMISLVPSSAALIVLAGLGDGALAFAWSRVVGLVVTGYVLLRSLDRNYWPGVEARYVRPLIRFGFPLAMANVLSQILLNIDYVFVGRLMSTADVGLYMLAFQICTWPTALLGTVLNSMVLPTFSTIRRDGGDLGEALFYAARTVALLACPIAAFTCAFATPLITTVYGQKWAAAGPVLSVLALYGMVFVLGLLLANVLISIGRTGVLFAVQIAAILALVPALAAGVTLRGLVGAGLAHVVVVCVVTLPAYLIAVRKATGVSTHHVVRALVRPLSAAVAAVLAARLAAATVGWDPGKLATGLITFGVVYVLLTAPLLMELLPVRPAWVRRRNVARPLAPSAPRHRLQDEVE
jgi:PST family polysaccharide transporter